MLSLIIQHSILTLGTPAKDHYFPLLPTQLPKMPQIHTIRVACLSDGVPLNIFKAIFSAPGLKSLDIMECPYMNVDPYDARIAPLYVPMRDFAYRTRWHEILTSGHLIRTPSVEYGLQLEKTSLWRLLVQMNSTLETLLIPGETAQLGRMANVSWPCLRELTLYGVPPATDATMSSVISRMPSLRTLHLELIQLQHNPRFLVSPPGSSTYVPPQLTSFTLSWPSPDDQVFRNLPYTLRHLSLRDSLRIHALFKEAYSGQWLPILTGRDMLRIIEVVDFRSLESLEILYYGGVGEREMLEFISVSLPSLRRLELHRFRPERWFRRDEEIPVVRIS